MRIVKDLPELVNAEVINQETADRIYNYYLAKNHKSPNKIIVAFGILGAILIGLGIILIVAHNWDDFSSEIKTVFAFLPLLIGQLLCGFTILKKSQNSAWRESAATFLFFAVGASISLISQIYHIPGNMSTFILTWMLLCVPLVYLLKSSMVSMMYLVGITWYASEIGYFTYPSTPVLEYWILMLLILPHYYTLVKQNPKSNYLSFLNCLVPLSIVITLGTLADKHEDYLYISYMSLFAVLYFIGISTYFEKHNFRNDGYLVIGSLGTIILLLILSFKGNLQEVQSNNSSFFEMVLSPEFISAALLSIVGGFLLYKRWNNNMVDLKSIQPIEPVFIAFIFVYYIGLDSIIGVILINLMVFFVGIITIINGSKRDHLGIMNYGLIIITALVICRFFDTDITFVIRGLMFLMVGAGFFATNYFMLKRRKTTSETLIGKK